MSDEPSKKFLQLIKVLFDVSTGVVRDFAENNILGLPEYGGSFIKFLDLRKHEIYHKWQPHTPCCHCGDNFKSCLKDIENWRFDMLYQTISDRQVVCVKGKGLLKINGCMKQYCICNIIPKQMLSLNEMDISMLSFLVRDCDITPFQLANIQNLNTQRCRLCHAYSTDCLSNDDFDDIWTNLENATLELASDVNHYYHKSTKEHLKTLKSHDVTAEEHSKLHSKVLHELSYMQKTNNGVIRNGFTKCESNILEAKEEIIQNTDTKLAEITEHIQQLKATVNVLIEQQTKRTKSPNTSNDQHKGTSRNGDGEASSADLNVQQGAIPKRKPNDIRQVRATCHVEGEELDELSAVQSLPEDNHNLPSDVCFDIITAEQKCLLLQLVVPSTVLESKESFRMALRALIIQIARAGKIDINKPSTITLNLIFKGVLTEVNMKVIQEISDQFFFSKMVEERLTLSQSPTEEFSTSNSTSTHSSNYTIYAGQPVLQRSYQGYTMQPIWSSIRLLYPAIFPAQGRLPGHREPVLNAAYRGIQRIPMPLTMTQRPNQTRTQYLPSQPLQHLQYVSHQNRTCERPPYYHYPYAVQNEARRVDIVERCSNCEKMSRQNIRQRTACVQLEYKNQDLKETNNKLQSLWASLNSENSKLLSENRKLQIQIVDLNDEIAALNMKLNRQQEVQGWVEGIGLGNGVGRRMGSRKSSGTGSMIDELRLSPTPSDDSLSFLT